MQLSRMPDTELLKPNCRSSVVIWEVMYMLRVEVDSTPRHWAIVMQVMLAQPCNRRWL